MKRVGIVRDDIFLHHHAEFDHPENPLRLMAIYQAIDSGPLKDKLINVPARKATVEEIELIHSADYIKSVEETAKVPFSQLDPDTYACAHTYDAALLAAGGAIEIVEQVLSKKLDSGFAFVRPPGHHSEKTRAMGFCIFNNIAIAAKYALEKDKLKRIAIIDFDLHHGNGTQNSFYETDELLFISIHQYPYYPGSGSAGEIGNGAGEGYTINIPVPASYGDIEYAKIFQDLIIPVLEKYKPQLILSSAGFDIYKDDPLGGMQISKEGIKMIGSFLRKAADKTCKGKLVYFLEGGYSSAGLAEGSSAILETLLDDDVVINLNQEKLKITTPQIIAELRQYLGKFWKF
jgi:acetoin utilization deacetylase AcuC-like enzyme